MAFVGCALGLTIASAAVRGCCVARCARLFSYRPQLSVQSVPEGNIQTCRQLFQSIPDLLPMPWQAWFLGRLCPIFAAGFQLKPIAAIDRMPDAQIKISSSAI